MVISIPARKDIRKRHFLWIKRLSLVTRGISHQTCSNLKLNCTYLYCPDSGSTRQCYTYVLMHFSCVCARYLCMCSCMCAQLHVRPGTDISCLPRYSPPCLWTWGLSVDLDLTQASRSEGSSNLPPLPPQG